MKHGTQYRASLKKLGHNRTQVLSKCIYVNNQGRKEK